MEDNYSIIIKNNAWVATLLGNMMELFPKREPIDEVYNDTSNNSNEFRLG